MQDNPFTNPSDEAYRLKRPEKKYGFNAHTILFQGLVPAFIGVVLITLAYVVVPALMQSFQQNTMRYFSTNLSKEYADKIAPLQNFDFSNTSMLLAIAFGALLGIVIKYFYSNERPA